MLCIERRAGESLYIGDDVQVEIVEIGCRFLKLAVRAPRALTILRGEVSDRGMRARDPGPVRPACSRNMLIVRRRASESLSIGDDIEITVVHIRSSHAALAVRAPRWLQIRRPAAVCRNFSRF